MGRKQASSAISDQWVTAANPAAAILIIGRHIRLDAVAGMRKVLSLIAARPEALLNDLERRGGATGLARSSLACEMRFAE